MSKEEIKKVRYELDEERKDMIEKFKKQIVYLSSG
ncbi:hypothetical protein ES702_03387 [subsurface metagenome]